MTTLWGIPELAAYLGYSEKTVARMVSGNPDGLPPRVSALARPRWQQAVVEQWARDQSIKRPVVRNGRPRNRA